MIRIVDYKVGNVGSIRNMFRRLGINSHVASAPTELPDASLIVLPGVGSFDYGMMRLQEGGWPAPLSNVAREGKVPILGICLGAQLMMEGSEEGKEKGLGFFRGKGRRFDFSNPPMPLKVPHMGWNEIGPTREHPLFSDMPKDPRFYFVHSFYLEAQEPNDVLATTTYGIDFPSVLLRDRIVAMQFHPEKSHRFGMKLLENLLRHFTVR